MIWIKERLRELCYTSNMQNVEVPQGTVLGPIIFDL